MHCNWCRNVEVKLDDPVCKSCKSILEGPLIAALEAYHLIADHHGVCCAGISVQKETNERFPQATYLPSDLPDDLHIKLARTPVVEMVDVSHLYIHPKNFEDSNETVTVECGVCLYTGFARCYWIFDSDRAGVTDSHEYGPEISYQLGADDFMKVVDAVLHQAADSAAMYGVVSCPHCGDHYHQDEMCDCREVEAMREEDTMNPYCTDPLHTEDDPEPTDHHRDAAATLRGLVDYADAADPQLIDALQELACLCEADAPTPLIQDKLRLLASEVQPQDAAMADDLRHVGDRLDD